MMKMIVGKSERPDKASSNNKKKTEHLGLDTANLNANGLNKFTFSEAWSFLFKSLFTSFIFTLFSEI